MEPNEPEGSTPPAGDEGKLCARCKEQKHRDEFRPDPRFARGLSSYCRPCHSAASIEWQRANRERVNARRRDWRKRPEVKARRNDQRRARYDSEQAWEDQLARRYRLTKAEYLALLQEQDGKCAVCRRLAADLPQRLAVDHDHACCDGPTSCGKCTRGLLCSPCNFLVGHLEDPNREAAEEYIQREVRCG